MRHKPIVLATALAAACATTPAPPPSAAPPAQPAPKSVSAAELQDLAGTSPETAVEVPADAPNDGFDWENEWIYNRYGRFRRTGGGMGNQGGRKYDQVNIELADHTFRKVFFDITENWKNWKPPVKQ